MLSTNILIDVPYSRYKSYLGVALQGPGKGPGYKGAMTLDKTLASVLMSHAGKCCTVKRLVEHSETATSNRSCHKMQPRSDSMQVKK